MGAPRTVVLGRTDSIGDVMLTLPAAGVLKQLLPDVRIVFVGRRYTLPVLRQCRHVDLAVAREELCDAEGRPLPQRIRELQADVWVHVFPDKDLAFAVKAAGVPTRIGTSHRWWHWFTCDRRVAFSRKRSDLHEAQLNLNLFRPLGLRTLPAKEDLAAAAGFSPPPPDDVVRSLLIPGRQHVVLHPLSKGSAVEWGLDRFSALMAALPGERYQVVVTGTADEAERYRGRLPLHLPHVTDAGGALTLDQLMALVGQSRALVAASTGPLHIAAASGIRAIGLYADRRPIHPGRWGPLGPNAISLVAADASDLKDPLACIRAITVDQVLAALLAGG